MAAPLLQLRDIALGFGGPPLLTGAELSVSAGERVALVGRNGSGKSTLLKIAAGLVEPDGGSRFVDPGATVRYLPQEPRFDAHGTTLAYVAAGLAAGDDAHRARYLLDELGLTGEEDPATLSGGEARRAALARVLAPRPDILLLDEPTNHLDLPTIEWLEQELLSYRGALVLISHDRRFLENLSRITVWLDRGVTRRLEIGFGDFEARRDEILAQEELDRHKLDRRIVEEEHWLRYGVTARRKRNMRRLADLHALRRERRESKRAIGSVTLTAAEAENSSKLAIEAIGVAKAYDGQPIVTNFSIRIRRGERIGIVGPNGAGKTTLIGLLTGTLQPDSGAVKRAGNLEMARLDQRRDSLEPSWTLSEALTGGRGDLVHIGDQTKHVIGYMKDFLFAPEQARTPVGVLSGGERGRLALARALARPSNMLVLDEPTNDLDLETLDVLEEMIGGYQGTALLISHDRDFLDRLVDAVIAPEGNGRWQVYAGGYSDMLRQRKAELERDKPAKAPAARAAAEASPPERKAGKARLSFNEQHALKTLPGEIDRLMAEIARFQAVLDIADLYTRDRKSFDAASAALASAATKLAAAEERWLELEMKREEIEGA